MPTANTAQETDKLIGSGTTKYNFSFNNLPDFSTVESIAMNFFITKNGGGAFDQGKVDIWITSPGGRRLNIYDNFDGFGKDTDDNNDSDANNDNDISFWGTDSRSIISTFMDGQPANGTWQFEIRNNSGDELRMSYLRSTVDYDFEDIAVTDIRFSSPPVAGETVALIAEVENVGTRYADAFDIEFWINDQFFDERTVSGGLPVDWSNTERIFVVPDSDGLIKVEARVNGVSGEGVTTNNSRTETFVIGTENPEAIISDLLLPGDADVGETIGLTAIVENTGTLYTLPFDVEFFVNDLSVGTSRLDLGLGAGLSSQQAVTYTVTEAGPQVVRAVLDIDGAPSRTEQFNNDHTPQIERTIANSLKEIEVAAFMARVVYGDDKLPDAYNGTDNSDNGRDDNYRDYLALAGWDLLDDVDLAETYLERGSVRWQPGGLFEGGYALQWPAQAIVAERVMDDGARTVSFSFRGTDNKDGALSTIGGQAWTGNGLYNHYTAHQDIIEAVLAYVNDPANNIDRLIVSGHSLGGSMADIFAAVDGNRVSNDVELAVIALASAGVDPDVYEDQRDQNGFKFQYDEDIVSFANSLASSLELDAPDYYLGLSHRQDRVTYPDADWLDDDSGLAPDFTLTTNRNFDDAVVQLRLPNVANTEFDSGFGAHHDIGLYFANLFALVNDPLAAMHTGQTLHFGRSDYANTTDLTGRTIVVMDRSSVDAPDDRGDSAIAGLIGADYILGLDGGDEIDGKAGYDLISGGKGKDRLQGGDGNDTLSGGEDGDTIDGGAGIDLAYYGDAFAVTVDLLDSTRNADDAGFDVLLNIENLTGGTGANSLFGSDDANDIRSQDADDFLAGRGGNDRLSAFGGLDTLFGGLGNDTLSGGDGNDLLGGGAGDDSLLGQDGDDALWAASGDDIVLGGAGDDTLGGALGDDDLQGEAGEDELWGALGNDTLSGGADNDTLGGAAGNDLLSGDDGDDALWGAADNDTLSGGTGNDTLGGAAGDDSLSGDDGADELWGALGSDTLSGGAGDDQIGGGAQDDLADGGDGNDTVSGGRGNDSLSGDAGDDLMFGSLGDDTLTGGTGNDTLYGGAGVDVFVFAQGDGADDMGINLAEDHLRLSTDLWTGTLSAAQVVSQFGSVSGTDYLLDFGSGDQVTLLGQGSATTSQLADTIEIWNGVVV